MTMFDKLLQISWRQSEKTEQPKKEKRPQYNGNSLPFISPTMTNNPCFLAQRCIHAMKHFFSYTVQVSEENCHIKLWMPFFIYLLEVKAGIMPRYFIQSKRSHWYHGIFKDNKSIFFPKISPHYRRIQSTAYSSFVYSITSLWNKKNDCGLVLNDNRHKIESIK